MSVTPKVDPEILVKLKRRRSINQESAAELVKIGWKQISGLDGLLWCVACDQATVWKDETGRPLHLWCSDLVKD